MKMIPITSILISILTFQFVINEKFLLSDYKLSSNSVYNFKRFVYSNNSFHNATLEKSGLAYNLTLNYTGEYSQGETFHIYLIKSNIIPHFDLLSNPAICCSSVGGIICDSDFEKMNSRAKEQDYNLLKTHATYYKITELSMNNTILKIEDRSNFEAEGVYYSMFLVCSPDKNQNDTNKLSYEDYTKILKLNGSLALYNSYGFLSAEEYYFVDLYLFLSLYYFLISLYWVYNVVIKYFYMNIFSKMIIILLPTVILENFFSLHIFSELNRSGELNVAFETISIISNIIKNLTFRITFYVLSLGYTIVSNNTSTISKKKIFNFCILLFGYLFSLIIYSITYSRYIFSDASLAYLILSLFFMQLTNVTLLWKIYKGLRKLLFYSIVHKLTTTIIFMKRIIKIAQICTAIAAIYVFMLMIFKLSSNYDFVWKFKWLLDILAEFISLIIFTSIIVLLQPRSNKNSINDPYKIKLEESHITIE